VPRRKTLTNLELPFDLMSCMYQLSYETSPQWREVTWKSLGKFGKGLQRVIKNDGIDLDDPNTEFEVTIRQLQFRQRRERYDLVYVRLFASDTGTVVLYSGLNGNYIGRASFSP
jgi:hypothetical protein